MSSKVTIESGRKKEQILGSTKTPMFFPSDLKSAPYYMVLTPIKYTKEAALESNALNRLASNTVANNSTSAIRSNISDFGTVLSGANRGSTPTTPTLKVNFESGQIIALPLPAQLSDGLNISYNTTDLGAAAAGFQAGQSLAAGELGLDDTIGAGAYALRTIAGIQEQVGTLISLLAGSVPNPYSVLTFKNVEQRTFSFDWTFAPNSEVESRTIREIINTIRYLALPSQSGLFLEFPYEWEIQFVGTTFLYSMSRGYITDLKVEYGSSNGTAFFPIQDFTGLDGAPSQIRFSFTFKEIFPLNKTLINPNNASMSPEFTYLEPKSPQVQRPELSEEQIEQINESAKAVNDATKFTGSVSGFGF